LIGPDGTNIGVIPTLKAKAIADEADLDLVEVAPDANPPVCRVMDYGSFYTNGPRKKKKRENLKQKWR